ncbi:hypothetical protein CRENBAI_000995 [Crenichthys baileyi]|uniref:Uncharacterized protein n=1 Tax=Crenichthys baileyi TaxID=28760 RepID=A0AAV9RE94_9TELE
MLAWRRACCPYINPGFCIDYTQAHLTWRGPFHTATLYQNSSKMGDCNPVNQEVEHFNKQKLRKTSTQEKNHLPTKEEIEEEKKAIKEGNN